MRLSKLCYGFFQQNSESRPESRTPTFQRFACGVGHVLNDIIRQLIFSFRLVFFMKVLGLSAANAGWLILYGLAALAVISPFSAFLVDKVNIPFLSRKLGRRKSWHLIGTVLGAVVVPLYFSSCLVCQSNERQWQMITYVSILNTFLAFAVSLVEIGHLSIIPAIAKDQSEAVELNAWRTGFTFSSGILTYLVAWGILGQDSSDHLSPKSSMDFTVMTLILMGIGLVFAAIYHIGTKEPCDELVNTTLSNTVVDVERKCSLILSNDPLKATISTQNVESSLKDEQQKQWLSDRFINSLRAEEPNEIEEENISRFRKKMGFPVRFIDALLFVDEKHKNVTTEDSSNANQAKRSVKERTLSHEIHDDEETFKAVERLPQVRKRSLIMGIFDRLMGLNGCDVNGALSNRLEEVEIFGSAQASLEKAVGVDNHGYDFNYNEAEYLQTSPDQIAETIVDEVYAIEVMPESSKTHCGTESGTLTNVPNSTCPTSPATLGAKTVRAWLKDFNLYKVGIIFTCAKVSKDISYSYLPLFLTDRLNFEKDAIANLPLVLLISGAISSVLTKKMVGKIGTKWTFILAGLLVIGAASWCYFITQSTRVSMYPAAVFLGFGLSAMFVNALSFAAELVGENKSTSGVVFAFIGLMSNLTGGALISTIQKFFPSGHESEECDVCGDYVRHVFSIVPGSLAAISLLIVLVFQTSQTSHKRDAYQTNGSVETEQATEAN